jgi:class 3 adenylate cyclase/putative methionine-R-sulfoxide reductase with GAF domain
MKPEGWLDKLSIENKGLYYKLSVIFGMFFVVPVTGFLYFAVKFNILADENLPIFFIAMLIFFLFGFIMLRKIFDEIGGISKDFTEIVTEKLKRPFSPAGDDELGSIVRSFQSLEQELRSSFQNLEKKKTELTVLKELSELCYITFNYEDLLYITLEQALKITDADVGSVMILNRPKRDAFTIEANIGLSDFGAKGSIIPFDGSIAKYAVINKTPLLVEDIATDSRFGRQSRPQYATTSFICMPLKTINDVIGVLTVSRRKSGTIFQQNDVDALTPLLSNAAFTHDNLRLLKESEALWKVAKSLGMISQAINSSLRGGELLQSLFQDIRRNIPCDIIALLKWDSQRSRHLSVADFLAFVPTTLNRGDSHPCDGTIFDMVIKQQRTIFIDNVTKFSQPLEKNVLIQKGIQTCLVTPLKVEGQVAGLCLLYNAQVEEASRTLELVDIFADHLAQAMEKDRLLDSIIKREQDMKTLRLIGGALSSSTFETNRMLTYTMDMIRVIMNVQAGYLLLLEGDELVFAASFHLNINELKTLRLKRGEGIAGYVADRGITVSVKDARIHPHFSPAVDLKTGFNTQSILSVPMISKGSVIGVIEVLNKIEGLFNREDEQLLESIASSVSIALENARLYGETVALAEKERGIRNVFQKFVPREVVDRIIIGDAGDRPILEEFRTLTLLNIDIRNFSPLSKKIGPQKTVALLNHFFSVMGEIVFKHHGIVDKYLGDGFLALFGAPVPSASDTDNAVAAGLEMQKALPEINRHCADRFDSTLIIGGGIHAGEVVIGNIGFEKKMDYTVIGDAVNFVFKLQSLCRAWPNEFLISEAAVHAAKTRPDIEEVGSFEIEPGMENLKIYRLLGEGNS